MPSPDEMRELSRRFIDETFNKRNLKYAEEHLTEDFVEHNPLDPRMGNGKAAAIASFQAILDATPDLKVEVHELIAGDDRIAIRATYSGTDSGTGWGAPLGAPATGKPFASEGIDVAIVDEEGLFREHYGISDAMGLLGQLGLLPSGGGG